MNRVVISSIFIFSALLSFGQIDQPSVGAQYAQQTFYSLSDGASQSNDHTAWDIAFGVDEASVAVFVNEGVASSMVNPFPEVELYETGSTDFAVVDTTGMERIYNKEVFWQEGAFNHVKDPSNSSDKGWGSFDAGSQTVEGTRIFVIKLRSGFFKKLLIESLDAGVFTIRYADLDGSNEQTASIDKADYTGKTLAYYSIENEEELDLEPAAWDLQFTRYYSELDAGGDLVQYMVTGVLSNQGVQAAKAEGIDPSTVNYQDYESEFSDLVNAIGHDWKSFDLVTFSWVIPEDLVYFVKTTNGEVWKVQFLDFEGSSTGITTLQRTLETVLSAPERSEYVSGISVYPNPATTQLNLALELDRAFKNAPVRLYDAMGRMVLSENVDLQSGLNVKELNFNLPAGIYRLSLQVGSDFITETIIIQ